jgi:trans-2,3-dihydro-3-hydroxyanthranilate isomerase
MTPAGARIAFCFVDVFAHRPLTGNPLSLVPGADGLTEPQMRAIAREFNQSETTFVLLPSVPEATCRLRSFTPIGAEVFGAGHNALGAWLWLAAAGRITVGRGEKLAQEIGDDVLPVEVSRGDDGVVSVTMDQSAPEFGGLATDRAELAAALGLTAADLVPGEPAQVVSTGAGHLLVPLRDRAAVDRARPVTERLAAVLRQAGGEGCYLYSRDPAGDPVGGPVDDPAGGLVGGPEVVAYTRFFNPVMGIAEDPATGTAAGPLVARLVAERQVVPDGRPVIVEQGYALGRPSRIQVSVAGPRVRVGGSGLVVAEGTLAL